MVRHLLTLATVLDGVYLRGLMVKMHDIYLDGTMYEN